jgi:hypothetical protein
MMFGPTSLVKDSGWHRSPVSHVVRIIVRSLFSDVLVSEEVQARFECNPFSSSHNLHQQILKSLCLGMKVSERPVMWRTQPSSQLKFKSPVKLHIPASDMTLNQVELASLPSSVEPSVVEVRPTQRDVFINVMKGETPSKSTWPEWEEKVKHLNLMQSEHVCPDAFNVFHVLHAKCLLLNVSLGHGKAKPGMEAMNMHTKHLHFKLYPAKKQRLEFMKQHKKITRWPHHDKFAADLDASPGATCVFDIPPTSLNFMDLVKLQEEECKRLLKLLDEKGGGMHHLLGPSKGSFPLFIASRCGIWSSFFFQLVVEIHALHVEMIAECQQDDATADHRTALVKRHSLFLGVFTMGSIGNTGSQGLQRPK